MFVSATYEDADQLCERLENSSGQSQSDASLSDVPSKSDMMLSLGTGVRKRICLESLENINGLSVSCFTIAIIIQRKVLCLNIFVYIYITRSTAVAEMAVAS
jgi:hypothetical protein